MFTATADRCSRRPSRDRGRGRRGTTPASGAVRSRTRCSTSRYREQLLDAVSVVAGEQERAGLDIVTNGDYHLDPDLGGPLLDALPARAHRRASTSARPFPRSRCRSSRRERCSDEVSSAWRVPAVAGRIGSGARLEFDKLWRIAQSRANRPVKFGTVSSQLVASMLDLRTDVYADDKRELMWDLATAMNAELRTLVAAGCRVIQIEEPLLHFVASSSRDRHYLDFLIDCFNHEISGLDDAEVWIHTCWGNANMQRVLERTSYAEVIETYLERVAGDVWTVEMKDRSFADLELFQPYRNRLKKKIAVGVVSHRTLQVESPEEVANDIRYALNYIEPGEPRPLLRLRLRATGLEPARRVLQVGGDRPGRQYRAPRARCRRGACASGRSAAPGRHPGAPAVLTDSTPTGRCSAPLDDARVL